MLCHFEQCFLNMEADWQYFLRNFNISSEYLAINWFKWMENWYLIGLTSEVRRLKFSILRQTSKMWFYHEWHIYFHALWGSSITQTKFGSVSIKLHVKPWYLTVAKIVSRQMETHKNMINRIFHFLWYIVRFGIF